MASEGTSSTVTPSGAGKEGGRGLARQSVGLPGVLFQSVTFMAPGGAIATSLAVAAAYAGGALSLSVLVTLVAALIVAASIAQLARHLPSAGSIYTYPAQGLHPYVGFLVGWGYALITGLVGPIVNLLIGYFVGTELNTEFGWNFRAMWLVFMLLPAVLTALAGYFGVKFGTRVGVVLGGLELLIFIALSIWMFAHATASASQILDTFTLKYATVKGFTGASGLFGGAVYVLLAFVGFEAAAPLAEEARSPRRTVPRAVLLSCLIVGLVYLFTTLAVAAYVGPAHMATYGGLGGGSPWILFARQLWSWGWVILFLAIINSFFANGNSALIAATRTWYAMGRIDLLPTVFARTDRRHAAPVTGIAVQTLLTVVIALPLGLHYGPATAFQLLATILSTVMIGIYIVINISVIGYYARKQRAEFNWLAHVVLPVIGSLALLPVLAAAIGVGASWLKFVSPLPYPISQAGLAVGIWFAIGVVYLVYLAVAHPGRVRDMEEVFG
jgi:amino acid transporter